MTRREFDAAVANARVKGLFPDLLGIIILDVAVDRVVGTLRVRADLTTRGQILHGGAIMSLGDALGAIGTVANLPAGCSTVTVESSTRFLAAARLGAVVRGESRPLHRGRATMVWQTTIADERGKLCAVVCQTQLVVAARPQPRPRERGANGVD